MKKERDFRKWIFWFSLIFVSIIAYKTIDSLGIAFEAIGTLLHVLLPFILAGVLAYLLYTPCKAIEETYGNTKCKFLKKHRVGFSILTVYFIIALVIIIIVNFVRPAISKSIIELANNLPNYYNRTIEFLKTLPEENIWAQINITEIVRNIEEFNISEMILDWVSLENLSKYIKGIVGATGVVFDLFVIVVVSIYLLLERKDIKSFILNLMDAIFEPESKERILKYYSKTNNIFYNYISSQLLDAIIVGVIVSIIMNIMGVSYATLLGMMVGLFNIIPYFGAIVGVIIAAAITIFTNGITTALWMTLIVVIVQQLDANILNPRILGNSLNVSPILVIFATTVGGAYFGILGMFLGVPSIALIKILVLDYIKERKELKDKESVEEE